MRLLFTLRLLFQIACFLIATLFACSSVLAQGFIKKDSDLPDASKFYMARQQITIIDDSPILKHEQSNGAAAGSSNGALPSRPAALPKAGWQPYSQMIPSVQTALPKVNNGVPAPEPPAPRPSLIKQKPRGLHATAAQPKPIHASAPEVVKSYTPYHGYGSPGASSSAEAGSASSSQSHAHVQGSVLHWARSHNNN